MVGEVFIFEINIVNFGYREGGRIATAGFLQGSAPQTFTWQYMDRNFRSFCKKALKVYGYSNAPKTQDIKEDDYYSSKVWETFNGNL